jgi:hypothetical protein
VSNILGKLHLADGTQAAIPAREAGLEGTWADEAFSRRFGAR